MIAHENYSDEQLIKSYRNSNNIEWLGILFKRYTLLLLGVGFKCLKNKELAQDAVQQIFLKLLMQFPNEEIHNFKGWIYVIMKNHCFQIIKKKENFVSEESIHLLADTSEEEIYQRLLNEQTLKYLKEAMVELKEEQLHCITLFYIQKLTYSQIMGKTGYSFLQVKSYIQNGKRNLKNALIQKQNELNALL